jgi:hypothetical protein
LVLTITARRHERACNLFNISGFQTIICATASPPIPTPAMYKHPDRPVRATHAMLAKRTNYLDPRQLNSASKTFSVYKTVLPLFTPSIAISIGKRDHESSAVPLRSTHVNRLTWLSVLAAAANIILCGWKAVAAMGIWRAWCRKLE